jgi:hypothetical protein
MRRRRLLLFLLAGAVAVTVGWLAWPREREPEYKGRKLSEWILCDGGRPLPSGARPSSLEANVAFWHIGTNGLPWALKWIQCQPKPWRTKVYGITSRLPRPFRCEDPWPDRANGALRFLTFLGADASPAVPELTRLLNDPGFAESAWIAIVALSHVGAEGLRPLLELLGNPRASNREQAAFAIAGMYPGTNAPRAVAAFVRCLSDQDETVAAAAALGLGHFAVQPELVVPALVKALEARDAGVRHAAAVAIPNFGDGGRPAVPSLLEALNDADFSVRDAATNALRQIAPEVLPKEEGR